MDYNKLTKDELLKKIHELEVINRELIQEKEQGEGHSFWWAGNLGQWYWNVKTNQVTFGSLTINNLGYSKQEVPATDIPDFFTDRLHPEDYDRAIVSMRDHLAGKTDLYELEYRIRAKNGSYKWCYDRGKVTQYDDQGKPLLVAGIIFDINDKKEKELRIKACNKKLREQVMTDELTGLKNRRSVMAYLEAEIAKNKTTPLSIVIFDIDDFSRVNDSKGHLVGDKVLVQVGEIMMDLVRKTDRVSRYGGEEFLLVYPNSPLKDAVASSERIRKMIEEHIFEEGCRITISGGGYEYQGEAIEEFIDKADQNLYRAKTQGKNQISTCSRTV